MRRVVFGWVGVLYLATAMGGTAQDRRVVVVDPGHGGEQAGVEHDGMVEKDLVLRASFAIAEVLSARGYDTRLTRTGDYAIPGAERVGLAEDAGALLMISIHINGNEDPTLHGLEMYANLDASSSARAAEIVGAALRETGAEVRVEHRPWDFLKSTTVPTLMIEMGFMTHPVEQRLVTSGAFYHALGRRIADAADELAGR